MIETMREPIKVDLASQGGGSHDAFAWGVLDRLLEEPSPRIEAVSATSAGVMNTAAVGISGDGPALSVV
jgi:NTE family protein